MIKLSELLEAAISDEETADKDYMPDEPIQEKAKLGSGARFKAIEKKAKAGGAKNPAAVAAAAGNKAHGKKQMQKWAKAGRNK